MAVIKKCIMQRVGRNEVQITEIKRTCRIMYTAKIKARVGCRVPRVAVAYWATVYFDNAGLIYDWKPETKKSELKDGAVYLSKTNELYYWNKATGHFDDIARRQTYILQDMLKSCDDCILPVAEIA